jgi:putative ABC transport system substrate-binding protein
MFAARTAVLALFIDVEEARMNRRETVFALLAMGAAPLARAQPAGRLPRVGLLSFAAAAEEFPEKPTIDSMRELGWIDGRNIAIEYRYAGGWPNTRQNWSAPRST